MEKRKLKAKYSGTLRLHWAWSVGLALTLFLLTGVLLWQNTRSGIIALVYSVLYMTVVLLVYFRLKPRILRDMVRFAGGYGQVQRELLENLDLPSAILEPDGRVVWMNQAMADLTGRERDFHRSIGTIIPEINSGTLPVDDRERELAVRLQDRLLTAHIRRADIDGLVDSTDLLDREGENDYLYMVCLFDETELQRLNTENRDQKVVVGLIYIDNYEEVMDRTDEVHQSLLNVMVERKISKYLATVDGLVKKLEKDKYFVVITRKNLDALREDRFSILDGVKTTNIGNDQTMTISIGIGTGGKTLAENYEFARSAIEMALGRGGDQAVIKNDEGTEFYGGKSLAGERNTRVRARVKAQALRDLILTKDRVVTMGHSRTDMDSFGAAIGVVRAAMTVDKPVHVVLGDMNPNIRGWVERFRESRDYPADLFITHEEAVRLVGPGTAVVVVDTNRPSMTECREILAMTPAVVVLDHHRQTTETIENAALSYIEPNASSACEMIAEILQYFEDNVRLRNLEADCMYAGIIIDTNNFVAKTGVRTFEAAAYLRRNGADVTRVRKALRDDMDSYKARADAVRSAEAYMGCYAISILRADGLENPSVVGAQAANELLNIIGVKASFVVTPIDGKVFISARSIDELNVQLVMERLGGGGHLNIAGAQLPDLTAEEAVERIRQVLKEMTEEGAI